MVGAVAAERRDDVAAQPAQCPQSRQVAAGCHRLAGIAVPRRRARPRLGVWMNASVKLRTPSAARRGSAGYRSRSRNTARTHAPAGRPAAAAADVPEPEPAPAASSSTGVSTSAAATSQPESGDPNRSHRERGPYTATTRHDACTREGGVACQPQLSPSTRSSRSSRQTRPGSARRVRPRALAAAEQLGPMGRSLRARRDTPRSLPGWPDDPETVEEANAHPEVFADKTVGQVADHFDELIAQAEQEAGRDRALASAGCWPRSSPGAALSAASVAIDPAPFRGVLPLPVSALRSASPVLQQPGQSEPRRAAHVRAVPVRVRKRGQRGRGEGAVRHLRGAGTGRAALPGRDRELQPVDRGQGRQRRTPTVGRS